MKLQCPECGYQQHLTPDELPPPETLARCPNCGVQSSVAQLQASAVQQPGGFWLRLWAALADSALVGILQLAAAFILGTVAELSGVMLSGQGQDIVGASAALLSMLLGVVYYVFFIGRQGQTPGKMMLRLQVQHEGSSHIGYGRAFLREVIGKFLSGALLGIGYLMVAFNQDKRGLHDYIAGTHVQRLNKATTF